MPTFLLVPIHLDALVLPAARSVLEPMADFSRLPYFDGQQDVNADVANLSELLLSQPFQDRSLILEKGIHLHWALPDALTRGRRDEDGTIRFPAVPDRWLVTRSGKNGVQKQWIVESNYLHPPAPPCPSDPLAHCVAPERPAAITYPYSDGKKQPYRHLGRQIEVTLNPRQTLEDWLKTRDTVADGHAYLPELTAVGYGEPSFAAFYPNCYSVFGLYDPADSNLLANPAELQYEVIGWYSNPAQDVLKGKPFLNALAAAKVRQPEASAPGQLEYQALSEAHGWDVAKDDRKLPFPQAACFFARITFAQGVHLEPYQEEVAAAVAIGNTSTEALAAYLGERLGAPEGKQLEEQLEALQVASRMEGRRLDIGPKFREARHDREFSTVHGGLHWVVRAEIQPSGGPVPGAASTPAGRESRSDLPAALADQLERVNRLQQQYDRDRAEIELLRRQLFADWHKYMITAYPPSGEDGVGHNLDEIRYFVEKHDLRPLWARIAGNDLAAYARLSGSKRPEGKQAVGPDLKTQLESELQKLAQAVAELQLVQAADLPDKVTLSPFLAEFLAGAGFAPERFADLRPQRAKDGLVMALNQLVSDPSLFDRVRDFFGSGNVTPEDLDRLGPLVGEIADKDYGSVLRRNRLLLQTIFPDLAKRPPYTLKAVPAPRFYLPNEPVILLAGVDDSGILKPTSRHGQAGLLTCGVSDAYAGSVVANLDTARKGIARLFPGPGSPETAGASIWNQQPWHPFLFEWDVQVSTIPKRGPGTGAGRDYGKDYITTSFDLAATAVDLALKPDAKPPAPLNARYVGRSILTPHAKLQLLEQIDTFLEKQLLGDYLEAKAVPSAERTTDYFDTHRDDIIGWFMRLDPKKQDAIVLTVLAVKESLGDGFHALAQSLSGFNAALLGAKQTLQLPVGDPLGFAGYGSFTADVAEAVAGSTWVAPQPHNDFNPIRSGVLAINAIRLVDTFGRVQRITFDADKVHATEALQDSDPTVTKLPPRLVQPARLNFRWLDASAAGADALAEDDDSGDGPAETNSHPGTSPVCGWLVPNLLDNSLAAYDAQGRALGSLVEDAAWFPAPGSSGIELSAVPQPLQRVLGTLQKAGSAYLGQFLDTVEEALENIEPERGPDHDALILLMGRPIAVVRALVKLELQGLPAVAPDWESFAADVSAALGGASGVELGQVQRSTAGFTEVEFPVRIGEHGQLNDGLLGYWKEQQNGELDGGYVATQDAANLHLTLARDSVQVMTMLMDPRGDVHATTGILPTKAIHIPPDHYADALRSLEVTFLSAPVLTDIGDFSLPLPDEPGYAWSWVERAGGQWTSRDIGKVTEQATFAAKQELREGWLKLSEAGVEAPATTTGKSTGGR